MIIIIIIITLIIAIIIIVLINVDHYTFFGDTKICSEYMLRMHMD
jgi:TRAP-type C4-dicarboxylate transport system permease small subunit